MIKGITKVKGHATGMTFSLGEKRSEEKFSFSFNSLRQFHVLAPPGYDRPVPSGKSTVHVVEDQLKSGRDFTLVKPSASYSCPTRMALVVMDKSLRWQARWKAPDDEKER